ncbi:MAG: transposase [Candidatus Cloacimonadota bacterium]|nr:transposase [Candidatus Cloacimonadota bacterium]
MDILDFFDSPKNRKQVLYEALRKSIVEKCTDKEVCKKFNLKFNTFRSLKADFYQAIRENKDFSLTFFIESKVGKRSKIEKNLEEKIISLRRNNLSIVDIKSILSGENVNISLWKINNILKENNQPTLSRRTSREKKCVKLSNRIQAPKSMPLDYLVSQKFDSLSGSIFLFYPILKEIKIDEIINKSGYPETEQLSKLNMILSFIALKLNNTERISHDSDYRIDRGLGLFSGLNVLPKNATLSSYSYKINRQMNKEFIRLFTDAVSRIIPESGEFNLDFTTIPHWGDESVLEKHWSNTRHIGLKSILAMLVQDQHERNIVYTDSEIKNNSQSDAILEFIDFYKESNKKINCLIFDSKFTTYKNLSKINVDKIKFITLRRRGKKIVSDALKVPKSDWTKIKLSNKFRRKYRNLLVHDSKTKLNDYDGEIRQIVITNNGRKNPTFLITNDFDISMKEIVLKYGQRWLIEQSISESIDFFHLNKLSSSIIVKVDFDLTMTLAAHTIYKLFTKKIDGFGDKKAKTIYRDFIKNHSRFEICKKTKIIKITINKKSHLPFIIDCDWFKNEIAIPWLYDYKIKFEVSNTS